MPNTLLEELKSVLNGYQMNEHARALLQQTPVVLLASITAGGKNTLIKELLKTDDFHYIVSHTTRQPRENAGVLEKNGREYWFVSEQEMLDMLRHGEFIEAKLLHNMQVSGTSIKEFEKALTHGRIALSEIDVQGVSEFLKSKPETIAVFILPPDFETWMHRLDTRGSETNDQRHARMRSAQTELETALETDAYAFIINDDIDEATAHLQQVARGDWNEDKNTAGKEVAWQLLNDIKKELNS